jgi:hypothetical protein
MDLLL